MFVFSIHSRIDGVESGRMEYPKGYNPFTIERTVFRMLDAGADVRAAVPIMMLVFEDDVILEAGGITWEDIETALAFKDEPGFLGTVHIPVGNAIPTHGEAVRHLTVDCGFRPVQ